MRIYILSRFRDSYSTSRLKEVAMARGHQVRIVDHVQCELKVSEKPEIYYQNTLLKKPGVILPRIGSSNTYEGANVIRHFELLGVKSAISAQGLLNSRDKFKALQILSFNGIPVPNTYFSSHVNEWKNITKTVGKPPFVIKLLEGTQGLGVFLVNTKETAQGVMDSYKELNNRFLIQEYIEECKGTDVRVFVVGNKVVAAMKRVAQEGEFRSNIHRGGVGIKVKLTSEEEEIAIKSAQVLGLSLAGVDLLQSNQGPLVLEVNSSPGVEGIEKYSGVEVSKEIIKHLENL